MESDMKENFDLEAKNSSEKALQRWRKLQEKFRVVARTVDLLEKIRVAQLVSQAALQFLRDTGKIVYRRGPGSKPKSS